MVTIIDGKKLSKEILETVAKDIAALPFQPVFCDVLVGEDKPSMQYVQMKAKAATSVGMAFHSANFGTSITTEELILEIQKLNKIENMCGIILQLPLPPHIDTERALDAVAPELDVDCLGKASSEKFYNGDTSISPPAALACMKLLDETHVDLNGKNIVVLGQGKLVGSPVAALLRFRGFSPVCINVSTEHKEELLKKADIIISGIGQGNYIKGDSIKEGVILIDAGTSEFGGGIIGDVDIESVKDKASFLSPVPGGVGPVTVSVLLLNVLRVAQNRASK